MLKQTDLRDDTRPDSHVILLWDLLWDSYSLWDSHHQRHCTLRFRFTLHYRAAALDISKDFGRVWHAGLLHKLKHYGISGEICDLVFSFLRIRQLRVVLDETSSQEYPVKAGVPQRSFLGPTLFVQYINDILHDTLIIH